MNKSRPLSQSAVERLKNAFLAHQSGDLATAIQGYESVDYDFPGTFDVLRLLGTAHAQARNPQEAIRYFERALEINALNASLYNNLGAALSEQKKYDDAIANYQQALSLDPAYVDAHFNLGNALSLKNRTADSIRSYKTVLKLNPTHLGALNNLGLKLLDSGDLNDARLVFEKYCELDSRAPDAHFNLGLTFRRMGLNPEAKVCFERALSLTPSLPKCHLFIGMILLEERNFPEARTHFETATKLDPNSAEAFNGLGSSLKNLNLLGESLAAFDEAIRLGEGYVDALSNRANVLKALGRYDQALASVNRAIELDPQNPEPAWNKSLLCLLLGDFVEGWGLYESRLERAKTKEDYPSSGLPRWSGRESLRGKKILVRAEQGYGDTIQFSRYLSVLREYGAEIHFEVPTPLVGLFKSEPFDLKIVEKGRSLPSCDFECWLMSLCKIFEADIHTIPPPRRFTPPGNNSPAVGKTASGLLRVGLAWRGSATHQNDLNRSLDFSLLQPLFDLPIEFHALQHSEGGNRELAAETSGSNIRLHADEINSFVDTAGLIESFDLVISVDTSVAHLAGSMGKPVWILLPEVPDFRWLLDRTDSPWYPSARLFRQRARGDWTHVISSVREQLSVLLDRAQTVARPPLASATDFTRWSNPDNLLQGWEKRAQKVGRLLPKRSVVMDIGCGAMSLEKYLHPSCGYVPVDLVARDERTIVCDLNNGEMPERIQDVDVLVGLGVFEYVVDLPAVLGALCTTGKPLFFSYCESDRGPQRSSDQRRALGWLNDLTVQGIQNLLVEVGYDLIAIDELDSVQSLYHAVPKKSGSDPKRVAVLSYSNVGNFGDRLGQHCLSSVLPSNVEIDHLHHKPFNFPDKEYDLLVLGVGNSIFKPLLNDDLNRLIQRSKVRIGIFGTQYRQEYQKDCMLSLISSLDFWFARYEDDLDLYGRGAKNCMHLGDWLISQFPPTKWTDPGTVSFGGEIMADRPLDRLIRHFQTFKSVHSGRLHPLLCALTGAEVVSYSEQRESPSGSVSGKFESMLRDIFGRTFAENQKFSVDRHAVRAYRDKVMRNMVEMRQVFQSSLV